MLLRLTNAQLAFGHVPLLDGTEFQVDAGERVCLVGRNGTGKSTLLKVLAGTLHLDDGQVWRRDGLRLAMLEQQVPAGEDLTLFDVVAGGLGDHATLLHDLHEASLALEATPDDPRILDRYGRLQAQIEEAGAWEGSQRVDATLDRLGLDADAAMASSSGGIRRRAMLGRALVAEPDVLVLDEPTNHLDIASIEALESALLEWPGTVLFVTHDRALVDKVATRIVELDRGVLRSYPGRYAEYLRRKAAELAAEADAARKFDKNLAQEEVWIRQGIKARRTRNEGRVRRLEALRRERAARQQRSGRAQARVGAAERSGKLVLEAEGVRFAWDEAPVVQDLDLTVLRGDRIGVVGPNGAGKTTLLRLLLGDLAPDTGSVSHGTKLEVAYFDQERLQLDLDKSLRDNLADGADHIEVQGERRHVISYLGDWLFPAARADAPVSTLSGGERNRLLLARLLARPANLLVLDEPTNDLDVETLELLEEVLAEYRGTLLLVSHDRAFLDRTVTSILVLHADGRVEEHVGGWSDWAAYRAAREAQAAKAGVAAAAQPATPSSPPDKPAQARKLSYKDQRELDALPERIEALETAIAELQGTTADPAFYQQPKDQVEATLQRLADLDAELQAAYARWEALDG